MRSTIRTFAILGIGLAPTLAFAGGVKPGLWEMEMEGMDMPGIPPAQMEQMKKMGVDVSKLLAAQKPKFCMTEEQAKFNEPPKSDKNTKDCKVDSWDHSGKTMKGKMTCDGDFKGTMDFSATLKSDTEYDSEMKMDGSSRGHPVSMTMKGTSRWLSADCGDVKPYTSKK